MKITVPLLAAFASSFGVLSLITALSLTKANAAPPPSAFGVWDRGASFDPTEYPFLKGSSFGQRWADVE